MALEREVGVPRHGGDGALEEGVRVVEKTGVARILERAQAAAGDREALDDDHLETGLAEIGRQNEPVVAGAEDHCVVDRHHTAV